jgi:hypothetical protein
MDAAEIGSLFDGIDKNGGTRGSAGARGGVG